MEPWTTFIGTYTTGESDGIYRGTMHGDGYIDNLSLAAETENPTFLTTDPSGTYLYAVNEVDAGAVTAYEIDGNRLTEIDHTVIGPADPCHISVDAAGAFAYVAHYSGRAVSMIPLTADGTFGEPSVLEREGHGPDPDRQTEPHPHSATVGPNDTFLYVADLGTDEVVIYRINRDQGELEQTGIAAVHEGAGPRHLDFDPAAELVYLINELDSTMTVFDWDGATGALTQLHTVGTLGVEANEDNYPADIHVYPDGVFVYGSNRGDDSIVIFEVGDDDPTLIDVSACGGEWPRNFVIAPDGDHLFVANEHTDNIVPFEIDLQSGYLDPIEREATVPAPVCLLPLS